MNLKEILKENFPVLFATRFWVMVAVTVMGILKVKDFIDPEVANVLISFGLGFIGVRSLDRASEKVGEVKVTQVNEI